MARSMAIAMLATGHENRRGANSSVEKMLKRGAENVVNGRAVAMFRLLSPMYLSINTRSGRSGTTTAAPSEALAGSWFALRA